MNIEIIQKRIEKIKECAWDSEVAHGDEDSLYEDFIRFVAVDGPEPFSAMAKEVLKTQEIIFSRWCA